MRRLTAWSVRFFLLALLACCSVCWAAAGFALADEPSEYVPPADRALQPELPEMASCPTAAVPVLAEEEFGEVPAELRELGHLRLEAQESCRAQLDRLDQVVTRLWWVTAQTLALDREDPGLSEVNEWLSMLAEGGEKQHDALVQIEHSVEHGGDGLPVVLEKQHLTEEEALPVSGLSGGGGGGSSNKLTKELIATVEASGEGNQGALWMIVGVMVAAVVAYGLYRVAERNT